MAGIMVITRTSFGVFTSFFFFRIIFGEKNSSGIFHKNVKKMAIYQQKWEKNGIFSQKWKKVAFF